MIANMEKIEARKRKFETNRTPSCMKIYLAGPMSGYDQSNFPLFDRVSKQLRAEGWEVVSPAELDNAEVRAAVMLNKPTRHTWGDYLSRDVKVIADGGVEGIIFLPQWFKSKGARLEGTVGLLKSKDFKFFRWDEDTEEVTPLRRGHVVVLIGAHTL